MYSYLLYQFRETGILADDQPFWMLPATIVFYVGIAIVLSLKPVRRGFRPLVEPRAR